MSREDIDKDFIIQLLTRKIEKEHELRTRAEATVERLKTEVEQYSSCANRLKSELADRLNVAEKRAANFIDKQSNEVFQAGEVALQLKKDIEQLRYRHGVECANFKAKIELQQTELENKLQALELKKTEAENERNEIAAEVIQWQKKVMTISQRVTEQRSTVKQLKEKETELSAEVTRLTADLKKARISTSQSQMRAENYSKQLAEMRERLVEAEQSNMKAQEKLTQAIERRAAADALAVAARRRAETASMKAEHLDSDVRGKNERLQASYNELQKAFARLKTRNTGLQDEILKLKESYKSSQEQIVTLKKSKGELMEQNKELNNRLSSESQCVVGLREQLSKAEESSERAKATNQEMLEVANKDRERMALELKKLQGYIEFELPSQIVSLNNRNFNDREAAARQIAGIRGEIDHYKVTISDTEQTLTELAAMAANLTHQLNTCKHQQIEELSIIGVLQDKLKASDIEVISLKDNYNQSAQTASNEISQLRAKVSSLEGLVEMRQKELATVTSDLKKLNDEKNSAQFAIEHMHVKQAGDLQAKETIIRELENNNAMLERNVRFWREQFDSTKQELERTISESTFKLNALESELATSRNLDVERKDSATSSFFDYSKLEEQLTSSEAARKTLTEEIRLAISARSELQASLAEADRRVVNLQLSLNERRREIEQLQSESSERNRLLEFRVNDLNAIQQAVQKRMEELQEELSLTKAELNEKRALLDLFEQKKSTGENLITRLREQLSSRLGEDGDLKKEKKILFEDNTKLKAQLSGLDADISKAKKENRQLEAQLGVLNEKILKMTNENKRLLDDHVKLEIQLNRRNEVITRLEAENKQLIQQASEEKRVFAGKIAELQTTHTLAMEAFERETICRREWEHILAEKETSFHASVDEFEMKMTKKDKLLKQLTNKVSESRLEVTRLQKSLQNAEDNLEKLQLAKSNLQLKLRESESLTRKAEQRAGLLEMEAGALKIVSKNCDSPRERLAALGESRRKSLNLRRSSIPRTKMEAVDVSSRSNMHSQLSVSEKLRNLLAILGESLGGLSNVL